MAVFVITLIGNSLLKYPRDDRDENSLVATQPFVCSWDEVIHLMQAAIWLAD